MSDSHRPEFVFIQDCRKDAGAHEKLCKSDVSDFNTFIKFIRQLFKINADEEFVITTTNREEVNNDTTWSCIEDGDTLYILTSVDQELLSQAKEHVEFLPHYDTIVKGGMYEYYASEGRNPLPYAFAELIDNAIAATAENVGSRNIEIRLILPEESQHHSKQSMIIFLDNGKGMTSRQLNNWAIYRLSKFIRKDQKGKFMSVEETDEDKIPEPPTLDAAPRRSLNSDISYFGVGGKQAIFFIGNSTRMVTRPIGCPDVHELTISKEEFQQKEKNKEFVYSGWIHNRKPGDCSHIKEEEEMLKKLVSEEPSLEHFTAVVIMGIGSVHTNYLRTHLKQWTRQLAHIYHYYLHGPNGNVGEEQECSRAENTFSFINIEVKMQTRKDKPMTVINLRDIGDDMQTLYIKSSSSTFEFKASVEGTGIVEGVIRYHPFLYDRETLPTDVYEPVDSELDENLEDGSSRISKGRRSMFDCYWNGRLIPYTTLDLFEWCSVPKKSKQVPLDCYNRLSGVLWSNDKFQVSTNKLTFIDLEMKLRDKNTTYARIVTKETKKAGKLHHEILEKRTDIGREFVNWIKDCHEQYDKQIQFNGNKGVVTRPELPRMRQGPWTIFDSITWDNKTFKPDTMIKVIRVVPHVYGSIQRFFLYGAHEGDVFATGGEVEIRVEPRILYDDVKVFPLYKVDRGASVEQINKYIEEEEAKLPSELIVTFPNGGEIKDGDRIQAGTAIGDIQVEISNRKGERISKLPGSQQKKLLIELKVTYKGAGGEQLIAQHISQHGKTWPYWFRKMENIKGIGSYVLKLQTLLNESGITNIAGRDLPSHVVNFTIIDPEPVKFTIGFLDGPFCIGVPFQIPLEFQDVNDHQTKPGSNLKPEVSAEGLEMTYKGEVQTKGSSLILKDIVAVGLITDSFAKCFNLVVKIPGLKEDTQMLKIRMLPGIPQSISVLPEGDISVENGGTVEFNVSILDMAGNLTTSPKLLLNCKLLNLSSHQPVVVVCTSTPVIVKMPVNVKKMNGQMEFTARIEATGLKRIEAVDRTVLVKPRSTATSLELSYKDGDEVIALKPDQEISSVCGEMIKGLAFVIKDESGTVVPLTDVLASKLKVNWTPKLNVEKVLNGRLPDIKVPTQVTESKYCQVSLVDGSGVEFKFNVKGTVGPAAEIKCVLQGSNKVRLGEKLEGDILVYVKDKHGNELRKFEKGVLNDLSISGEGLLVGQTVRMLGQTSGFNIHDVAFESGPLGSRELCITWNKLTDYLRIEIVAGQPFKLLMPGWDVTQPVTLVSGASLPRELMLQLCDEAENPISQENVKVQLIHETALKLNPAIYNTKTNKNGLANFGILKVTAKHGIYEIQAKGFVNRAILPGPILLVSVQPDPTKPSSIAVDFNQNSVCTVGEPMPDFNVTIISEDKSAMLSARASCLEMKVCRADGTKAQVFVASFHPDKPGGGAVKQEGVFYFWGKLAPEKVGNYLVKFVYKDSSNEVLSKPISITTRPGAPVILAPTPHPGTPTVSNSKNIASRTLIQNMQLELRDKFGNASGQDVSGKITAEIMNPTKSKDVPVLVGSAAKLQFALSNGKATIQNLLIQENSPGKDGQEYKLKLNLPASKISYEVPFLFYNDLEKQSMMASLSKERDNLLEAVETYKSIFETTQQLIDEIKVSLRCAQIEENRLKSDLRKQRLTESELARGAIDNTIQKKQNEKLQLARRPRRMCGLQLAPDDPLVVGKIGHLAEVADPAIARVISWHMSADMDCVVTRTTKKAQEIYQQSQGKQQVLPLDSIYKKALPDWNKPLPHERSGPNWKPSGNPEYARNTLHFTKDEESCKLVFGLLLGDTLILDTLEDSTVYRQEIVKYTHCPTMLTRTGDRIRSNGKFGGLMNRALPLEKLRGAVFSEPMPPEYDEITAIIDQLNQYKLAVDKRKEAEADLEEQTNSQNSAEQKARLRDFKEAENQLKAIEAKLGLTSSSRRTSLPASMTSAAAMETSEASEPGTPSRVGRPRGRRSAPGPVSIDLTTPMKRRRHNEQL